MKRYLAQLDAVAYQDHGHDLYSYRYKYRHETTESQVTLAHIERIVRINDLSTDDDRIVSCRDNVN